MTERASYIVTCPRCGNKAGKFSFDVVVLAVVAKFPPERDTFEWTRCWKCKRFLKCQRAEIQRLRVA